LQFINLEETQMNVKFEKKQEVPVTEFSSINTAGDMLGKDNPEQANTTKPHMNEIRRKIDKIDAELAALVDGVIKQRALGTSFNPALVREMRKIETHKKRIVMAHFDALIKQGNPKVQQVIDLLLTIEPQPV
jgi:hypothetical protein